MRCGEVREVLFAFLDSELDAPLSIEFQRHLERCPHCAREAEVERAVRRHLSAVLEAEPVESADPDEAVRAVVDGNGQVPRSIVPARRRRARWPAVTVAMALSVGVAGAGVWLAGQSARRSAPDSPLVELLVQDFEHFLEKGRPLQVASDDPDTVATWLTERTALAVALPRAGDAHCRLVGGRKCKIEGRPAAFAIYDMHGSTAALVVLRHRPDVLRGMRTVRHNGETHWVDQCRDHTVVACPRGELLYAAVSTLPETELFCLMDHGGKDGYERGPIGP